MPDRLVADHVGRRLGIHFDPEHHQLALRAAGRDLGLDGFAADEVVVELQHAVHAGFERGVDRPELAEPGTEALLQSHGDECAEPEQTHTELLPRVPKEVEQGALVLRLHPDLVAEVAAVRHA